MDETKALAYLDHNVLDLMTKGDPLGVIPLIEKTNLRPVYSDENLREIQKSKGYEQTFLDTLDAIGAKYIDVNLDASFKPTGYAKIQDLPASERYAPFVENQTESLEGDFGLSEMLMKAYGGMKEGALDEVLDNGAKELKSLMLELIRKLDSDDLGILKDKIDIEELLDSLSSLMSEQVSSLIEIVDHMDGAVSRFEEMTGIGPLVLKNIKRPNVVEQIWEMLSKIDGFDSLGRDAFFGVKAHGFEPDAERERTLQEKVNGIYHQLNFLGYFRDSNMKKERRFRASFSDMTHAGLASFCHVFICRDEDLVMKAAAAYEYLNIKTQILYHSKKN